MTLLEVHVLLSLVGIASGFIMPYGFPESAALTHDLAPTQTRNYRFLLRKGQCFCSLSCSASCR
jgi:hypothetical protein